MDSDFLSQIIDLVETKLGLKSNSISLSIWEEMVKERMSSCKLATYEEYFHQLLLSPLELHELIERTVIPETWFFRDQEVFDFLSFWVKQTDKVPLLKILSLACSTGEEPYSIAMALFDGGASKNHFVIDAIDISKTALLKAKLGVYSNNSFRGNNLSFRDRYFDKTSEGYIIQEQIKEQVRFYYSNILENGTFFSFPSYHLIFCRNVLIYLNKDAQMHLLNRIKTLLAPQGILMVGSAEKQIALKAGFISAEFPKRYALILKQEPHNQSKTETLPLDQHLMQNRVKKS
jgi:chemotaxis protein methyltransferase WspC